MNDTIFCTQVDLTNPEVVDNDGNTSNSGKVTVGVYRSAGHHVELYTHSERAGVTGRLTGREARLVGSLLVAAADALEVEARR